MGTKQVGFEPSRLGDAKELPPPLHPALSPSWGEGKGRSNRVFRRISIPAALSRQSPQWSARQWARRTASAIATSTSRDPSKDSLPCAQRMLSTTSRSPCCHGARALLASYTSLIDSTTSALIGSPLPKRVLHGNPSSP